MSMSAAATPSCVNSTPTDTPPPRSEASVAMGRPSRGLRMSLVMSGVDIMHMSSSSRTRAPSLARLGMLSCFTIHFHASSRQLRHWRRNVKFDTQRPVVA